ncbi:hypothetical protein TNCV_3854051 [Trichonephila clavipes]|nr:hypothetical protein TNCV_3854051 [Trichonephila clavipes]
MKEADERWICLAQAFRWRGTVVRSLGECRDRHIVEIQNYEITKQRHESLQQACDDRRLLKVRSKRRIFRVSQSNKRATMVQIVQNLNQRVNANTSEPTVHHT